MISNQRAPGFRRFGRLHPMMLHELVRVVGAKPGDPIAILILASLLRDDLPWLYELGMDAYRAAKSGTQDDAKETLHRFRRACDLALHGPLLEEFVGDPPGVHMMLRELEHFLQLEPPVEEETPTKSRRRRERKEE